MQRVNFFMILGWWAVVAISLLWNIIHTRAEHELFILDTARSMFNHIELIRSWNTKHGGVYVPITDKTKPNPYLRVDNRDIHVNDHLTLTMINPAFMTRQIAEIAEAHEGIKFHITSLNPIRPDNQPSELERHALNLFENGEDEYSKFMYEDDGNSFFYMAPLITTSGCMKCHEQQGYQVDDVRGGISVTLPNAQPANISGIIIGHLLIAVFGTLIIGFLMNRLTLAYERVRQNSIIDALTGIPNRRYFTERILQETRRSHRENTPLTLMICDIDHFKKYNDHYGHLEGDKCLAKVASTICGFMRRPGDMCARYGGEEFVIISPSTTLDGGIFLAEEIRRGVEELKIPHAASPVCEYVTLTIGVATKIGANGAHDELIKEADDALYQSKKRGRNRVSSHDV